MLVLARKINEEVVIGPDIVVTVLGVAGHRVRLGFVAPRAVAIRRQELIAQQSAPCLPVAESALRASEPSRLRPR